MLIHASVFSVETRRTGTVPFDIHLHPNSGPSGTPVIYTVPDGVIYNGVIYAAALDLGPGSHSNSARVASFDPAVDDSSGTEACEANNLAQGIRSFINTMKLIDVSKFRTQLKIRLTTAEQVAKLRLRPSLLTCCHLCRPCLEHRLTSCCATDCVDQGACMVRRSTDWFIRDGCSLRICT